MRSWEIVNRYSSIQSIKRTIWKMTSLHPRWTRHGKNHYFMVYTFDEKKLFFVDFLDFVAFLEDRRCSQNLGMSTPISSELIARWQVHKKSQINQKSGVKEFLSNSEMTFCMDRWDWHLCIDDLLYKQEFATYGKQIIPPSFRKIIERLGRFPMSFQPSI